MRFQFQPLYSATLIFISLVAIGCGQHQTSHFGGVASPQSEAEKPKDDVRILLNAIQSRDVTVFNEFLERRYDFSKPANEGRPLFHEAVRTGALVIVLWFVDHGFSADQKDIHGKSVIDYLGDSVPVAKVFAPDLEAEDQRLLWVAIEQNRTNDVKKLLERNTATQSFDPATGQTPLTMAVLRNRELIVRALVQHQPETQRDLNNAVAIDLPNKDGLTALCLSKQLSLKRIEQFLVSRGAQGDSSCKNVFLQ